jgi:hypothetical protein
MVRSGAAPLIIYAFRRVRRSRSTEDATCEAPVHGEALEAPNLMGKRRYYRHSGERARRNTKRRGADMRRRATPDAPERIYDRSRRTGHAHRDVLTRIKRERVPTIDFMMKLAKSVLVFRSHSQGVPVAAFRKNLLRGIGKLI